MPDLTKPTLAAPLTVEEIEQIKVDEKKHFLFFLKLWGGSSFVFFLIFISVFTLNGEKMAYCFVFVIISYFCSSKYANYKSPVLHLNNSIVINFLCELDESQLDELLKWQKNNINGEVKKYIVSVNNMGRPFNMNDYFKIRNFVHENKSINSPHPVTQITN